MKKSTIGVLIYTCLIYGAEIASLTIVFIVELLGKSFTRDFTRAAGAERARGSRWSNTTCRFGLGRYIYLENFRDLMSGSSTGYLLTYVM